MPYRMFPPRSTEDLMLFVEVQCEREPALWELLQLDPGRYIELQQKLRAKGVGPWQPPQPTPPEHRGRLERRGHRFDHDGHHIGWVDKDGQLIRDDETDIITTVDASGVHIEPISKRGGTIKFGIHLPPKDRPKDGEEPEPEPEPPRRRAGAPQKLSDEVLRQHLLDHPDLSHAQRARSLTRQLKLQSRPLHRDTIASRVRALKKRLKKAP